jgi:PAS domain S-box-containing protein
MRLNKNKKGKPALFATDAILESISDGVFTVDVQWRITSFNRAAEEITGTRRAEAIGRLCSDVFRCSMCEADCALRKTIKTGKPIIGKIGYIINAAERRLPISVSTAVLRDAEGQVIGGAETFRDLSELQDLREELKGRYRVGDLSSRSPIMQRVFEVLPAIAVSPSTVLILGETGTGKELVARTIHELSPRHHKPFIAINCSALPDTLLESELFGYKAGAFTGAYKNKPGRFALAHGGTVFLDEIGEITPALQTKLLRVLQERSFEPLGATRSEKVDVRILVATNKDLMEQVRLGSFREDLYYRINVVRVELPPLRNRKEDIPFIVEQFIARFNRLQGKNVAGITREALSLLLAHNWPGNVRELENEIERAFVLCSKDYIDIPQLSDQLANRRDTLALSADLRTSRRRIDAQTIRNALQQTDHNRLATAKLLGVHKTTLYRQMKKLGIRPERRKTMMKNALSAQTD